MASVNPTSNDSRIVELLYEAIRSNSTALVFPDSPVGKWKVVTRTGEGLVRQSHYITMTYGQYSDVTIRHALDRPNKNRGETFTSSISLTDDSLQAALRRTL